MVFKARSWAMILIGCLLVSQAQSGMIDKRGMEPWETCAMCHSLDGISVMPRFPILAGQKKQYLEKQIMDFYSGARSNDGGQMRAMTQEIMPDDVQPVAAYFAQLAPPVAAPIKSAERAKVKAGKKLYVRSTESAPSCASCHDRADSEAPWLYGQHAAYLVKQITEFKNGLRSNDEGTMTQMVQGLSGEEIVALSIFLSHSERPEKPRAKD